MNRREFLAFAAAAPAALRSGPSPTAFVTCDTEARVSRAAYVTSGAAGTFRVHSSGGELLRETRVPTGSYNVQSGPGGLVLTPSLETGTLSVLDARGRLLRKVAVSASSHDACFAF
jgi:hypothetical protein